MDTKNRTVARELTTGNGDIYTVPPLYEAEVYSIFISNASSSNVTFSLDWYQASTTTYHTLAETVELPANSLLQITDYPLFLNPGDKVRGLASANSAVNISISLEEYFETSL